VYVAFTVSAALADRFLVGVVILCIFLSLPAAATLVIVYIYREARPLLWVVSATGSVYVIITLYVMAELLYWNPPRPDPLNALAFVLLPIYTIFIFGLEIGAMLLWKRIMTV